MPARWPPLLYLGFAHACLATALGAAAADPLSVGGFFYHPRMLAVVHLVTLGWISASILGSIFIVAPLAFRLPLPARWPDYVAFASFVIGVLGMASHFWIDSPPGMAWSAAMVTLALLHAAVRVLVGLPGAPVPGEARLPLGLAFANVVAAAVLGVLLAVNKVTPFLEVRQLDAVFAHAHLAALGWGVLIVMGAGYRILPMILPAAMPRGRWAWAGTVLVEAGVIGLVVGFLRGGAGVPVAAVLSAAGIVVFLSRVAWMVAHGRPAPTALRHPDFGVWHALQAMLYLLATTGLGLYLAFAPASDLGLRLAMVYGVTALLGFLAQIVVGVEGRILPLYAWLWGYADRGRATLPPSLYAVSPRPVQAVVFYLWTGGVPLLAAGLAQDRPALLSSGAGALFLAVVLNATGTTVALWRLWRRGSGPAPGITSPCAPPGEPGSGRPAP